MKLVCWNINESLNKKPDNWRFLSKTDADVALLQEAREPPDDVMNDGIEVDPAPFRSDEGRCAVVKLTEAVDVDEWLHPVPIGEAKPGDFVSSQRGCISAAIITPRDTRNGEPITVVSFCPDFDSPHRSTKNKSWCKMVDPSLHRVISDLSLLIGRQKGHRIIAAGDLTITYGYGENKYWHRREHTVFDRIDALGLKFMGPQYPFGRKADPPPAELPKESKNVPTFKHTSQKTVEQAARQLDYVFVSEGMVNEVAVSALNRPDQWDPKLSDHCRIEIEI